MNCIDKKCYYQRDGVQNGCGLLKNTDDCVGPYVDKLTTVCSDAVIGCKQFKAARIAFGKFGTGIGLNMHEHHLLTMYLDSETQKRWIIFKAGFRG